MTLDTQHENRNESAFPVILGRVTAELCKQCEFFRVRGESKRQEGREEALSESCSMKMTTCTYIPSIHFMDIFNVTTDLGSLPFSLVCD